MNFFRTLKAQATSFNGLRDAMLRRRFQQADRADIPPEADLISFVDGLSDEDFHKLLVVCGAFMAKARGYDVFAMPHPPE